MRPVFALALMLLSLNATGADREITLANERDFVILTDVEENSLSVFLSYTGKQFNHCGISIHGHSFVVNPLKIHNLIQIDKTGGGDVLDTGVVEDRQVKSKIESELITFGQVFAIKSRTGIPLREAVAQTANNPGRKAELIVTILPCD